MKLKYHQIPKDIQKKVKDAIEPYLFILPTWCQELNVMYVPEGDASMSCISEYKYRRINIVVHPNFIIDDTDQIGLHEMLHGVLAPYVNLVEKIIETYIEDEQAKSLLLEQLLELEEGSVEDLSISLHKQYIKKNK